MKGYRGMTEHELHEIPHPSLAAVAAVLLVAGRWWYEGPGLTQVRQPPHRRIHPGRRVRLVHPADLPAADERVGVAQSERPPVRGGGAADPARVPGGVVGQGQRGRLPMTGNLGVVALIRAQPGRCPDLIAARPDDLTGLLRVRD